MKRLIALFLAICMLMGISAAFAIDKGDARTVIGKDVTSDQKTAIYKTFGIKEGSVTELSITNAEERKALSGLADPSIIESSSVSCVYVEILDEGEGIKVTTSNLSLCTKEMYINALNTAGIKDAKVVVTSAKTGVTGITALADIYKAYEDISGKKLDDTAKLASSLELVTTAELKDKIGNVKAETIVTELEKSLSKNEKLTDDELKTKIQSIAKDKNITLSDSQISELVSLYKSMEKLSPDEIKAKIASLQDTIKKISATQKKISEIFASVQTIFESIGNFFSDIFAKVGK